MLVATVASCADGGAADVARPAPPTATEDATPPPSDVTTTAPEDDTPDTPDTTIVDDTTASIAPAATRCAPADSSGTADDATTITI